MVNKNNDFKINKNNRQKIIFSLILAVYFCGLCSGCVYAVKNSENLDFLTKMYGIENLIKGENTSLFAAFMGMFIRDVLFIILTMVFKYSGVLKGLCMCLPFAAALQNAGIYIINLYNGTSVTDIIFRFVLKDTATGFLLILFCYVMAADIINNRYNTKRDFAKLTVYLTGVAVIYIIDFAIKAFVL